MRGVEILASQPLWGSRISPQTLNPVFYTRIEIYIKFSIVAVIDPVPEVTEFLSGYGQLVQQKQYWLLLSCNWWLEQQFCKGQLLNLVKNNTGHQSYSLTKPLIVLCPCPEMLRLKITLVLKRNWESFKAWEHPECGMAITQRTNP